MVHPAVVIVEIHWPMLKPDQNVDLAYNPGAFFVGRAGGRFFILEVGQVTGSLIFASSEKTLVRPLKDLHSSKSHIYSGLINNEISKK